MSITLTNCSVGTLADKFSEMVTKVLAISHPQLCSLITIVAKIMDT